jgi:thioredoxin 1
MSKGESDNIVPWKGSVDAFKSLVTDSTELVVANCSEDDNWPDCLSKNHHLFVRNKLYRKSQIITRQINSQKAILHNTSSMSKGESDNIVPWKGSVDAFKSLVTDSTELVVANFWAQWCAPCRRLAGMLPQIASENAKVKFVKIDVDENPELAEAYEITGIPNVKLFKQSATPCEEIQGLDNAALREAIAKHSK